MENSYLNAPKLWKGINRNLAMITSAAAKHHLPPLAMLPLLRTKLLSHLENSLALWQEIENNVHPNVPMQQKWVFDRIGNILRSAVVKLHSSNISAIELHNLNLELKLAQNLGSKVGNEFFWYTTVMIMPGTTNLFSNPQIARNDFHNTQLNYLRKGRDGAMSDFVRQLRGILDIHKKNAYDLRKSIAINPNDPTLNRRYEMEIDSYDKVAKQLIAKGEKVERHLFDKSMSPDTQSRTKTKTAKPKNHIDNHIDVPSFKGKRGSNSSLKEENTMGNDIAAIRDSLTEYSELFKKNLIIDAHEQLKSAIESRFEILLIRLNDVIDELEQSGKDAYYPLETAKMLDMSIRRLRQQEAINKSKDVSRYLGIAIDMIDK